MERFEEVLRIWMIVVQDSLTDNLWPYHAYPNWRKFQFFIILTWFMTIWFYYTQMFTHYAMHTVMYY